MNQREEFLHNLHVSLQVEGLLDEVEEDGVGDDAELDGLLTERVWNIPTGLLLDDRSEGSGQGPFDI